MWPSADPKRGQQILPATKRGSQTCFVKMLAPGKIREGRAEASDLVSVQHAFAAIAETGTLMLPSAPDRPTTINLLPDTAIAVLRASRVVGAYEDAWDLLRAEHNPQPSGGFMPRNVMLVTGPSRSADIEQTLELGAHGPRRLHVVLIDDDPAALDQPAETPCDDED